MHAAPAPAPARPCPPPAGAAPTCSLGEEEVQKALEEARAKLQAADVAEDAAGDGK